VRTQLVGPFLAHLRARGVDVAPLLHAFALPPDAEGRPEVSLPLPQLQAFLAAAEAASGDAHLGLHVALGLPRGTYGLVEYIARASPTLRDAFRALARYLGLLNEHMAYAFDEEAPGRGAGTYRYGVPGEPLAYGRHANEYGLGLFVRIGRELTRSDWAPTAAAFAHPAPADEAPLAAHLRCPLSFGTGQNVLALSEETLALPVVSADPALLSVLERAAGAHAGVTAPPPAAAAPPPPDAGFTRRVAEALRPALPQGVPPLAQVARTLAVSARTLQRRLAEEGASYQDVVEATREELARAYLRDPRLGVSEVAYLLGYADLSTFDRAFKRWTGTTPRAFRGS
jgi:AraC-like DNA-binding protein